MDRFTYMLMLGGTALTLVDWLIGSEGRDVIRKAVSKWWEYVHHSTVGTFTADHARALLRWNEERVWSDGLLGLFVGVFQWVGPFVVIGMLASFWVLPAHDIPMTSQDFRYRNHSLIVAMVGGFLTAMIGLRLQAALVRMVARRESGAAVTTALVGAIVYTLFVAVMVGGATMFANYYEFRIRPLYQETITRDPSYLYDIQLSMWGKTITMPGDAAVTYNSLMWSIGTCLMPVVLILTPQLVFALSKIFRVLLQPPLDLILRRFAQSEKGVLTTLAVGGGILSKVIEESLKQFNR